MSNTENKLRNDIILEINSELEYSNKKWGTEFDNKNTSNDWVAYITHQVGKAVTLSLNRYEFEVRMKKVAGLAISAIEASRRNGGPAPRHYDNNHYNEELLEC